MLAVCSGLYKYANILYAIKTYIYTQIHIHQDEGAHASWPTEAEYAACFERVILCIHASNAAARDRGRGRGGWRTLLWHSFE